MVDYSSLYSDLTDKDLTEGLNQTRRKRRVDLAKLIGFGAGIPFLGLSTLVGAVKLATYPLESHDLRYLVSMGLALSGGMFVRASGMAESYIENCRNFWYSLEASNRTLRHLKYESNKRKVAQESSKLNESG